MTLYFSFFEKALVYGPQFIAALGAVLLFAAAAFPARAAGSLRPAIYIGAAALIFASCVLIFMYAARPADFMYGMPVQKANVFMLALASGLFLSVIKPAGNEAASYVLCLAAMASMQAAMIAEHPAVILAAFIAMDFALFAFVMREKENTAHAAALLPGKIVYAAGGVIFAALILVSKGRHPEMARAGCVIFMLLLSTPGLLALQGNRDGEGEKFLTDNSGPIMISGIITAVVAVVFLGAGAAAPRPVVVAAVLFLCFNIYRTITGEKYAEFAAYDSISPVFLLPALSGAAGITAGGLVFPAGLFMLSVFMHNEFISVYDRGRHTVAALKYGFEKVKGGRFAFFGILSGLAAEIWVFALFYRHLKQDPLIFAAVIFLALAYSVSMLNKLFMLLSMLKRIKRGGKLFIAENLRPSLFAVFCAALLAAWLK